MVITTQIIFKFIYIKEYMQVPSISPVAFYISNIPIAYYWLTYVFAFALAFILLYINREKLKIKEEQIYDLLLINLLVILIFARLFHVLFWGISYYLSNPILIPQFWRGGLSFHGGLIGAILATYIYTKKQKLSFFTIADILTLVAVLAHAFQRIVNLINHEIIGAPASSPLCFTYPGIEGCRHMVQIYASLGNFLLFAFLLFIYLKKPKIKPGLIFWLMIFLTGIGRFFLDFIRQDTIYLGLKAGQWLSIPMIIISLYCLKKYYYKKKD